MALFWWIIFTAIIAYFIYFYVFDKSGENEPPGPWGLPIVGYIPFLGRKANLTFTSLRKEYGDVYQIKLGSRKIVVVNGQRAIRQACLTQGNDFSGRPDFHTYKAGFGAYGEPGYTQRFRVYKRINTKAMGVFAHARKDELQEVAYRAVDMLTEEFKKQNGEPFEPKTVLMPAIWTIMGYFSYGKFFSVDDPRVTRVFDNLDSFAKTMMFGVLVDYFPWASVLLKKQLKQFEILMTTIDKYSDELAEQNIKTYTPGLTRNIADVFKKAGDEMDDDDKRILQINDDTLKKVVTSLFGAGFGTIASTARWSILLVCKFDDAQRKVQEELDRVLGDDKPTFADQEALPYTMAAITETYRYASMSAVGITHAATRDTKLDGYDIKEGTPVVMNLFSAHRDPVCFPDAEEFRPERFLHEDGTLNKTACELIMPFGLGARRCGGELIAKQEVFLFFTSILQRCIIKPDPHNPPDPKKYFFGLGISPLPFKVSFHPRKGAW